jgi:tetratricopeptide (TPR) repeat protein
MSRPRRPGEGESDDPRPRRNVIDRAQLRAALALEEAGELQEAARMFEYVGEHAQAASLRLEHADTLRDETQRLAVLREGCARNPATSVQGQALHRALGEALLRVAEGLEPGARRRALALEAAQALEDGQRPGEAGRLYEQLGLLTRAAKAYTEAGDIDRLESVHAILEQREQRQREQRNLELEIAAAMTKGETPDSISYMTSASAC